MDKILQPFIKSIQNQFGVTSFENTKKIQTLWSGYGGIYRLTLNGAEVSTVIVKAINNCQSDEQSVYLKNNTRLLGKIIFDCGKGKVFIDNSDINDEQVRGGVIIRDD